MDPKFHYILLREGYDQPHQGEKTESHSPLKKKKITIHNTKLNSPGKYYWSFGSLNFIQTPRDAVVTQYTQWSES